MRAASPRPHYPHPPDLYCPAPIAMMSPQPAKPAISPIELHLMPNPTPTPSNHNNPVWPIITIVAVVVALGVGGWAFVLQGKNKALESRVKHVEARLTEVESQTQSLTAKATAAAKPPAPAAAMSAARRRRLAAAGAATTAPTRPTSLPSTRATSQ